MICFLQPRIKNKPSSDRTPTPPPAPTSLFSSAPYQPLSLNTHTAATFPSLPLPQDVGSCVDSVPKVVIAVVGSKNTVMEPIVP
ncbi:hypothetical protein EX30DRAFT_342304 [Ascodesmis nigricans]|uniref:Uncharacterized protein n=1 Tax=Ascodesmis nigricans TaxID=341454 RepID=A0A4S2MQB5_9PEZI|nr:hypothetical protein EX30DRAFT_342304 [Ascodesmis nigricans]